MGLWLDQAGTTPYRVVVSCNSVHDCMVGYLFIYSFQHSSGMHQPLQSVFRKFTIFCQPETTKRAVSCFSRLLNLVNEQLSILELFKYNFNLHTIIKLYTCTIKNIKK